MRRTSTALLAACLLLCGCLGRVEVSKLFPPEPATPAPAAAAHPKPRLWYVGLGLYDESWSEGDVAALSSLLRERATGFQVMPLVLSDAPGDRFPRPDRANVDAVTGQIAQRVRPGDVVLIYVSTHGAPGLLARHADARQQAPATIEEVEEWLAPLRDQPTVLVLSACFSGSFIPALRADNRIIFAAARRDRTSFGCRAGAEHTVFGQALLDALATPSTSLSSVVQQVRAEVADKEHQLGVTLPSEPEVFVAPGMDRLYQAPVL